MCFRTAGKASNFRANTDKYGHLATLQGVSLSHFAQLVKFVGTMQSVVSVGTVVNV